jgi:hypothetical protein
MGAARGKGYRMPKGPQGQRRPADVNACAVMVAKVATGDLVEETRRPSGKARSGRAGAEARAKKLSSGQRSEIARKAARIRWGK